MNLNDDTKGDIKRTFVTIIFFLWQNKTLYIERHTKGYVIDGLQPSNERGNKTWLAQSVTTNYIILLTLLNHLIIKIMTFWSLKI